MNTFLHSKTTLVLAICWLSAQISFAADLPGSKDPLGIKRYEGSAIVRYEAKRYDELVVPLGKMRKFDFSSKVGEFEKSEIAAGAVTRVTYHLADPTRSSLEVFRNYERLFVESGWEIAWQGKGKSELGSSFASLYQSLRDNDQLLAYSDSDEYFLVARKSTEGLSALLFVTKYEYGLTRGIKVTKGDPLIQLDVVQSKAMEQKMIIVPASEMAKAIDDGGRVALYGITFDTNKTEIKPESESTLLEIAKLLREKSALKLLVAGHTDNVGDFEFNRDLSQRRAVSVVEYLKTKHGVDTARLFPFGVSFASPVASNASEEGRAKNRRVELVEIK